MLAKSINPVYNILVVHFTVPGHLLSTILVAPIISIAIRLEDPRGHTVQRLAQKLQQLEEAGAADD